MSLTAAEAAARLGVPEAEVAAVREVLAVGTVATTTDGREYVITDVGNLAFYGDAPKETAFPVVQRAVEAAEEPAEPVGDITGDGVPDGPAKEVLAWVGDDRDRAAQALAAERGKGDDARSTLIAALEKLVG